MLQVLIEIGAKANNVHATSFNASNFPAFTEEQWNALTQILNEKTKASSDRLSGKHYGDLILDTGSSHHMTGELSFLENVSSIPPCPVGFADGNKTFATHVGVFHLSNNITLSNVLFVPDLNCSLISVSKLLRQTNCFALLTDTLYILQDRFSRTLIGAGEKRDGVYYFKDVMAARVHVAEKTAKAFDQYRWHQRLGHPAFSVLSFLPLSFSSNKSVAPSSYDTLFRAKQTREVFYQSMNKTKECF